VLQVYAASIHYRDGSGAWQPIDDTLVGAGGHFENRANRYTVQLPSSLGDAPVRVNEGSDWASFQLQGATGSAAVSGEQASYPSALPGVTVGYDSERDLLKESLTLSGQGAASQFTFDLRTSPGLTPSINASGGLDFARADGQTVFWTPAPFMTAQDGESSTAVAYRLTPTPSGWQLVLSVSDPSWLLQKLAAGPVVIDPTLVMSGANLDCTINAHYITLPCHGDPLGVGWDGHAGSSPRNFRTLLRFDVQNSLPVDAQVSQAQLGLQAESGSI
jgi:hypothetical protein